MKTKYQVTDSRGEVHTRSSERTYTHAVVAYNPGRPARKGTDPKGNEITVPAEAPRSRAAWSGTHRLALREAKRWSSHPSWVVEVIEAQVVQPKRQFDAVAQVQE